MPRKTTTSLDETKGVRDLRARIQVRENELERAVGEVEGLKLELLLVQREYETRVEPLVIEVALLDEQVFALKKVKDLMDKGETLANARRIVRERDAQRDERERERTGTGEQNAKSKTQKADDGHDTERRKAATPELKKLWRELAYRFHPDLTQDSAEKAEREAMMKQLNDAYQRGDLAQMRELATVGCCDVDQNTGTSEAELTERLLDLDEALRRVTQRLLAFRRSPWHAMRSSMRKGKREKRDYLGELVVAQTMEVEARKKLVKRIEKELETFAMK